METETSERAFENFKVSKPRLDKRTFEKINHLSVHGIVLTKLYHELVLKHWGLFIELHGSNQLRLAGRDSNTQNKAHFIKPNVLSKSWISQVPFF